MKNAALCFLLIVSPPVSILAIDTPSSIGLEIGPNIAILKGSTSLHHLRKTVRSAFGLSYQYNIGEKISLKGGILYDCKGAKAPNTIFFIDSNGTSLGEVTPYINFNYLTIPILFQYSYGRKVKVFGAIGPYFSYLLNRKDIVRGDNTEPLVVYESKVNDKSFDIGGSLCFGTEFRAYKKFRFTIEARHNIGFSNILRETTPNISFVRNKTTTILFGIRYSI